MRVWTRGLIDGKYKYKKKEEEKEEKIVFLLFPLERLWGDLLGVMDAARRNVSVLLINHRVGRTCVHTHTDTHTRERRRKENEGRKNELSRISLADDGRVTGEREKNNHQHTFPP